MSDNFLNKEDKTIAINKTINVDLEKLFEAQPSVLNNCSFIDRWQPYLGKCPYCGSANIEADYSIVLTSLPPQYNCRCKICGKTFYSGQITDKSTEIPPTHITPDPPITQPNTPYQLKPDYGYGNYGWICPKCGKVNAPHRDFCDCSGRGYYPNIVYCNGTGNTDLAPTITTSSNTAKEKQK